MDGLWGCGVVFFIGAIYAVASDNDAVRIFGYFVLIVLVAITIVGIVSNRKANKERLKRLEVDRRNAEQNRAIQEIQKREDILAKQVATINREKATIQEIISSTSQAYPWMAGLFADATYVLDMNKSNALRYKSHPALKAADAVKQIAQEKRELQKLCKLYEYQINYYETIFPWLEEFKEEDPRVAWDEWKVLQSDNDSDDYQKVKLWLSPEEYRNLPNAEKYQLALDRYKKRKKSNWQVGIEYERYIGYRYEMEDYIVKYHGAILGMEDMGRDLLAIKGDEIYVIQCKRWSKDKTIHEKHIFQLYGSMILYGMQHPNKRVKGVFITTADLSDTAKYCADYLHITIRQDMPFDRDYPMIKCNISAAGERIYHLPFDQQYDHILITLSKGEFYSHTVEDAEEHGFRRAMRWKGNTISA